MRDSDPKDSNRDRVVRLLDDFRITGSTGERFLFTHNPPLLQLNNQTPENYQLCEMISLTAPRCVHGSGGSGGPAAAMDRQI